MKNVRVVHCQNSKTEILQHQNDIYWWFALLRSNRLRVNPQFRRHSGSQIPLLHNLPVDLKDHEHIWRRYDWEHYQQSMHQLQHHQH